MIATMIQTAKEIHFNLFNRFFGMLIQPVIFDKKQRDKKPATSYSWSPDSHSTLSTQQSTAPSKIRSEVYVPATLHVEDNAEIRSIVKYFLRKQCKLDFATDGNNAMNLVREKAFDVIIMDINLGDGIDGIETARQIREIDSYKDVPIIAVTANLSAQVRDHCLQVGMDAFLPKPFRKEDLINTINFVLERKKTGS